MPMMSHRLRVLAVDDEPLILMNLEDMLKDLGHAAVIASSGKAALDQLRTGSFDILLTDQSMPKMTGTQLIREATDICPSLGVILATGYMERPGELDESVVRLMKPFSEGELASALQKVSLVNHKFG